MDQIITSEQCFKRRSCCKFAEGDTYLGPVLSEEELKTIHDSYPDVDMSVFVPLNESKSSFKIKLIPSPEGGYVCPLYDLKTTYCGIYPVRPIDCSIWPVMVTKTADPDEFDIVISATEWCPGLIEAGEDKLKQYYKAVVAAFSTPKYLNHYSRHPELTWDFEPDWMVKIGSFRIRPEN